MTTIARRHERVPTALALVALAAAMTGCVEHDSPIAVEIEGGELFHRYVALGNSITAGFQSGGLHVGFQQDAYPVLLAQRAGAPFGIPALSMPGCPPPFVGPLTSERTVPDVPCLLRISPPPPLVQNLAVPGATLAHALEPFGTGTTLNTLILGGRTQVGAMLDARPTLVSVWLGNNDALAAALQGDTTRLTPAARFRETYDQLVDDLSRSTARDVILIGVADPAQAAPALQYGAYFWAMARSDAPPVPLAVDDNCAPFTPGGARLVSFIGVSAQLAQNPAGPVLIDCAADAPFLLNEAEHQTVTERVAAFNAHIQARALQHGWIYVDPSAALIGPALADPNLVRKCQGIPAATDTESFQAAVTATCPVDMANFFGSYFSFDGVHPSSAAHAVIADTLAGRLNARHGLGL